MLRWGQPYVDEGAQAYEKRYREARLRRLTAGAAQVKRVANHPDPEPCEGGQDCHRSSPSRPYSSLPKAWNECLGPTAIPYDPAARRALSAEGSKHPGTRTPYPGMAGNASQPKPAE